MHGAADRPRHEHAREEAHIRDFARQIKAVTVVLVRIQSNLVDDFVPKVDPGDRAVPDSCRRMRADLDFHAGALRNVTGAGESFAPVVAKSLLGT